MVETEPGPAMPTPWLTRLLIVLVILAFAATASLFAVLLRPLAGEKPVAEIATLDPIVEAPAPIPSVDVAPVPAAEANTELSADPAPVAFDGPRIAILLTGVGIDPAQSRAAIAKLPAEIGLAFSPYPDATVALAVAARADGHEVWAAIPMQPKAWPTVSPGTNTLTVGTAAADNRQRLDWALKRIGPATGITSIMGSAFTESAESLDPVMAALRSRKLMLLDSRSSAKSLALVRARAAGVPALLNDRFLDENDDLAARLATLEQTARDNGSAVGLASPKPQSVAAIAAWAKTLEAKGVKLVAPGTLAK